jgi:hypothetical protein
LHVRYEEKRRIKMSPKFHLSNKMNGSTLQWSQLEDGKIKFYHDPIIFILYIYWVDLLSRQIYKFGNKRRCQNLRYEFESYQQVNDILNHATVWNHQESERKVSLRLNSGKLQDLEFKARRNQKGDWERETREVGRKTECEIPEPKWGYGSAVVWIRQENLCWSPQKWFLVSWIIGGWWQKGK